MLLTPTMLIKAHGCLVWNIFGIVLKYFGKNLWNIFNFFITLCEGYILKIPKIWGELKKIYAPNFSTLRENNNNMASRLKKCHGL
jgi:hypothetical protein